MIKLKDLNKLPIKIFNDPITDNQKGYTPFAWTDTFLTDINKNPNYLLLHIWPMEKTIILGMLDRKLPYIEDGIKLIENYGYNPLIRNIGGLAVVSDDGILNFSIFIPDTFEEKMSISNAYLIMVELIKKMFKDFNKEIKHYEVEESYCPGSYDLSIDGKKFAGIAQRRVKKGIVTSIYLSMYGNQNFRGKLVANFYKTSLKGEKINVTYPEIEPDCMANLCDLLKTEFSMNEIIERIKFALKDDDFVLENFELSEEHKKNFVNNYNKHLNSE